MHKLPLLLSLSLAACGPEPEPEPEPEPTPVAPATYELDDTLYTSLQRTWRPRAVPQATLDAIADDTFHMDEISRYEELGLGVEQGPGEPWIEHEELAPGYDQHTPQAPQSLLWFWQSADPQVIDEESPIRLAGVTRLSVGSTFRPQSHLSLQTWEAQVRTARAISDAGGRPFDFTIITGDLTDTGQANELYWLLDTLNGGVVHPDSGVDDDPVPGSGNDFNDPYNSVGLDQPWYAVLGNHETLFIGSAEMTDEVQAAAVGSEPFNSLEAMMGIPASDGLEGGFRDGATVDAEVRTGVSTIADPMRYIPGVSEALQIVHDSGGVPEGHGLTQADIDSEKGYYSFHPIEGAPIRVVALHTLWREPATEKGGMDEEQFAWLEAELDDATAASELVIVASHHRSGDFYGGSPVSGDDLSRLLTAHDNVVLHITGHGHYSRVSTKAQDDLVADGHRGYWEVMTASTVDFPLNTRAIELVYEGDNYLSIYLTNIDSNAREDSLAHRARNLAAGHRLWKDDDPVETFDERAAARNLLLRVLLPPDVAGAVEAADWPDRVESVETLQSL